MKRFVEGQDRAQLMLLPECLDDFVGEHNPVRVVDAFIDADDRLFASSRASLDLGFLFQRLHRD